MIAQLDEKSLGIVVKGMGGRSCGLSGCYLAPRPKSYNHLRHKMLKDEGRPLLDVSLPVWDFVVRREDGTLVRLHPQRQDRQVKAFELDHLDGTYLEGQSERTKDVLMFDSRKG
jgi:hypothetical protein